MRNEIKKTLSLGALCTMAFFAANSAFADYYNDAGTLIVDVNVGGEYVDGVWVSGTAETPAAVTTNQTYDNLTVGAGSTFQYASAATGTNTRTLNLSNLYLYGNEDATAIFKMTSATSITAVTGNVLLDYGTWTQSAANKMTVGGSVTMDNTSSFSVLAGTVTVAGDFTVNDDSTLRLGGGSAAGAFTVSGALTLNDSAYAYIDNGGASNVNAITTLVMNNNSVFDMSKSGTLRISTGGSFTINDDASFTKSAGTLTFQDNTSLTINGGSFTSNATTLNGTGTIYLALESVNLSGEAAVATLLGSIELGTITYGTGDWSVEIDISVLDSTAYASDFVLDFADIDGIDSDLSSQVVNFVNSDYYTAELSGTTVSFTYVGGTAVPEPSTYAMIFGVVALGFAAYRRRK